MTMRTNKNIRPGQTWRDSDPRRLRLLRVIRVTPEQDVICTVLYPASFGVPTVPLRRFLTTGPKGLTRMS